MRIFSAPTGSIDVGFFSAVYKKGQFSKEISLPYAKNEFKIIQYGDFLFVYINKKLEVYFFGYKTYGQESFLIGSNDDGVRVENVKILSRYVNTPFLFAFYVAFCLFAFFAFFLNPFTSGIKAVALYFPLSAAVYLNFSPDMGAIPFFPVYVMGCLTAFLSSASSSSSSSSFMRRRTFCFLLFGMLAVKDICLKYDSSYFFMPSSVGEKIFFAVFLWGGMRYITATLSLKNAKYVFAEQSACLCITAVVFYMTRYFFQMPFLQIVQVVKTCSGGMDPDWSKNNGIYNVFINASPRFPRDRIITHLDLFPTILEAAGYQIKGGRIRLGVSAFSGEKTIVEKTGIVNLSGFLEQTDFKKMQNKVLTFSPDWGILQTVVGV